MKISINYIEPTVCTARFGQLCGEQAILTAIKRATPEIERRVLQALNDANSPYGDDAHAIQHFLNDFARERGISLERQCNPKVVTLKDLMP